MSKGDFDKLIEEYKEYCKHAVSTQTVDSNSFTDFLGWLLRKINT